MHRVVITGAGTINALGHDVPATIAAFAAGTGGIGALDIPDVDRLSIRVAGQVRDWTASEHFDLRGLSLYDRMTQFALWSARQAVAQSGLVFDEALGLQAGVILGTAVGGLGTIDDSYRAVYAEGKNRVHPLTVPRLMASAGVSHISMTYGLRGPAFSVSTACASSNHAMGLAFQMVRAGASPVMLTGGAEAMLTFGGLKAWEGLRVMAADACRPFSADRSGMVQGEGAAVFVFENHDHARARGAEILAEVVGFAMCSDSHDIVMPSVDGAVRAMRGALSDARLDPGQVDYINAHGTGTKANDVNESTAIRAVFGDAPPLVSSTKAAHGHIIGGTGAVEMLACLMALRDGVIAPTLGYRKPDPDCLLDVVPNTARRADVTVAMTNAFAFGGLNAVLVLRRM
ncbi:MAG: beta-ketoacyl-[acyl-carrier-protein] synthase family protein [Pseudotabrizicola sp.]|uniref:beta-ketoacyl-[acyl-carrier-protein] synthase family protein n=1 Tax=Pseudotabrizicola sp. TaxID=2939647 RepID=UPI00273132E3|nr:beta-ketoacyl-[acyl-carrier-protein] synthase family protein [Pseudotabrizicola sp.]MDP2083216.1 beta-ketoacyl-[acyl-carrier-protein] synthase family protein [Pseudotabrizicola sp.]MDZ7572633.1 beta-ketoacyl-[acyl-carrier-protein] synthase family protein [Pseudotabrizicola sp.]